MYRKEKKKPELGRKKSHSGKKDTALGEEG